METLPDLLSPECANAVQAKTEDHAVFLPHANIESVILCGYGAAVPAIADGHCRTHERAVSSRVLLKVVEERRAAKESTVAVAEKE